jgi:protein phosphatase
VEEAVVGGFALRWGSVSHPGKRRELNEDATFAAPGVFLVADGMGGHSAGEVASAMVVERFAELTTSGAPPVRIAEVSTILDLANSQIRRYAHEAGIGPIGTTVVGLVIAAGDAGAVPLVFHVGDSRAYRRADGRTVRLTHDHSEVQELIDAGLLEAAEARTHPQRNVITRSLGHEEAVAVDFSVIPTEPMRVLLCSDGLVGDLDDNELDAALAADDNHPREVASALLNAALAREARDNVSAVVVDLVPVGAPIESDVTAPRPGARRGWAPRDTDAAPMARAMDT